MRRWLRQLICGLHGHDALLHFESRRVSLRCHCGYDSPGWTMGPPADARKVVSFRNLQVMRDKRRKVA